MARLRLSPGDALALRESLRGETHGGDAGLARGGHERDDPTVGDLGRGLDREAAIGLGLLRARMASTMPG